MIILIGSRALKCVQSQLSPQRGDNLFAILGAALGQDSEVNAAFGQKCIGSANSRTTGATFVGDFLNMHRAPSHSGILCDAPSRAARRRLS